MPAKIAFEVDGTIHPTSDGKKLKLGPGIITGELNLSFCYKDESADLPTDVLSATYRIADNTGQIWSMTTRFTAEVFVTYMNDLSATDSGLFYIGSKPEVAALFDKNRILEDVRFSSDDRFYRHFQIENDKLSVPFHYTTLHFDIAIQEDTGELPPPGLLTKLVVKIKENSIYVEDKDDSIKDFGYYLSIHNLLRINTAVYSEGYERWKDSPISLPVYFERLPETSDPQDTVTVIE